MDIKDIKKIFEGADLSDEVKAKVAEIYEAQIEEETQKITLRLEEEIEAKYASTAEDYSAYIVSEMEEKQEKYITEELVPSVDKYVEFAISEFVKENKVVLESSAKVELADKFLTGFSGITEAYNVVIPEGKDDQVDILTSKLDEANKTIDGLLTSTKEMKSLITKESISKIISKVSGDMTETQKEKFAESCSKIKFIDDKQYTNAVSELKESYSPSKEDEADTIVEKEQINEQDKWLSSLLEQV